MRSLSLSSADVPLSLMLPTSSTYARSTTSSTCGTFCSTMSTVSPFGADALHELEHLLHDERRQAGRRLVHQQELRPRHQRAADRAHLLLAAGERAGKLLAPVLEAGKQLVDALELDGKPRPRLRDEGTDAQLSSTVSRANSRRFSGTWAMPCSTMRCAGRPPTERPSSVIAPPVSGTSPEMTRINVVLPAPFGRSPPPPRAAAPRERRSNRARNEPVAGGDSGERQHQARSLPR